MSKFNMFDVDHDWLASDRLIDNAERMLETLKEVHFLLTDPDAEPVHADRMTAKIAAMISHIETGE